MDWKAMVGTAAPLIGSLLGTPAAGTVIGMVADALGTDADPEAIARAVSSDPEAANKLRRLELDHKASLRKMALEAETARLAEVNQTMRAEAASTDPYVRRWRPTYGYLTAAAWFVQMVGFTVILGFVAYRDPGQLAGVVGALGTVLTALLGLWGIALAVLGVNISKRSQDKQVAAGQQPPGGFMGVIAKRLAG